MTLRPLSRFLWIFLVCLTLIACSDTITPPSVPEGTPSPEDGALPDDTPEPAPEPGETPEPGDTPAPEDTPEPGDTPTDEPDPDYPDNPDEDYPDEPAPDYPDNPEDAPEDPGEDPNNPEDDPNDTPAPEDPAPDEPVTTPRNLTLTLLKTFQMLDTRELDNGKGLVKRYDGLTYRPLNEDAWDRLDIPKMLSNRTPQQDPDDWNRRDWLSLTFNRDATVAVIWSGSEIPGWLSSWQEVDTEAEAETRRFEKRFKQSDTAELGRGEGKGFYNLLIGEADGGNPVIPALPNGISERPTPNERCPDWVHDQYVAQHPDDGRVYRTWHPSIDPVYWCYFEHEHGSDPALANYTPYFGYTAAKNSEDERHEGFKGFVFKQGDTNWYLNAHVTTGLNTRACVRLHTVVLAATDANGELLAELSFKGDFGEARANTGDRAVITHPDCPQQELAEAGTEAKKQLRILNQSGYKNNAYEEWDILGQAFLGLAGPKPFNHIKIDTRNPVTGCDGLSCERFELTNPEKNHGDVRTLHFKGDINLGYSEEHDMSDGKKDGYFYTDAKGTKYLDPDDENAVRQYVSRDLTIRDSEKFGTRDPWRGLYSDDIQRFLPGFKLEDSLGLMN